MKHEIEADVPEGYKAVAYRRLKYGELFIDAHGNVETANSALINNAPWLIVEPVVQYREPTAVDVGRECEFSDDEKTWSKRELAAVLKHDVHDKFISYTNTKTSTYSWRFARIIDDGQRAKVARDLFVNEYRTGLAGNCYSTLELAEQVAGPFPHKTVRFVEVID